tara:strand:+ start:71 stop:376 length:306 start_codon:yes stop_codon:yes gene_type:complete
MSFPTPNDTFIREFKENFDLIERDFLEPKKLQGHLTNIERLIERDYLVVTSEDTNLALSSDQKKTISDLLKKIVVKQKESEEKLNWSNGFSGFLQDTNVTK